MVTGHVFAVDRYTFPVHRDRQFCGVLNPENEMTRFGLYADLMVLRKGDYVFFYQYRTNELKEDRGFRGVYKVLSCPFFDVSDVKGTGASKGLTVMGKCPTCGGPFSLKAGKEQRLGKRRCPACGDEHGNSILPNRVLIKTESYYLKPVDDNTAYINHTNHGMLWTMLFRKTFGAGRARSITHILPEETEKLLRLLKRLNRQGPIRKYGFKPYTTLNNANKKAIKLELGKGPKVNYESKLEDWFMKNIDKKRPVLKEIIGDIRELNYFGNNVLYGIGGEKVDVLCLHNKNGKRYKATVFELKKDGVTKKALEQINDYSYWVAQLATAYLEYKVKKFEIQPVLIGNGTSKISINDIKRSGEQKIEFPLEPICKVTVRKPIVLEYNLKDNDIFFKLL
jgi:hypothetical protein